jgi:hypothetical protein
MLKYKLWFEKNKALFYNSYNVDATNLSIIPPSPPSDNEPRSPSSPSRSPVSWGRVRSQFNDFVSAQDRALDDAIIEHKKFIALWTKHALRPQ